MEVAKSTIKRGLGQSVFWEDLVPCIAFADTQQTEFEGMQAILLDNGRLCSISASLMMSLRYFTEIRTNLAPMSVHGTRHILAHSVMPSCQELTYMCQALLARAGTPSRSFMQGRSSGFRSKHF